MNKLWMNANCEFGVKLITDRVLRQLNTRQSWMWERDNDGIKFCILPSKKWKFI